MHDRIFGLLGCLLLMQTGLGIAQNRFNVELADGLVTLEVNNVELTLVLQELATQGGFSLRIMDDLPPQLVSTRFERLSLQKALRRLLADSNHALVYGDNAEIVAIYLVPPGEAIPSQVGLIPDNGSSQELLQQMPGSGAILDQIRDTLLSRRGVDGQAFDHSATRSMESVNEILERLQQIQLPNRSGTANPAIDQSTVNAPESINEILERLQQVQPPNQSGAANPAIDQSTVNAPESINEALERLQ